MIRRLLPLLAMTGCIDLGLPQAPPPPGAGVLEGTLVYAEAGQTVLRPAVGATVELVGAGVRTASAADTGFFSLSPVDTASGSVLIRFDSDGDGRPDRQRALDLEPLRTGRGKTVNVGQLILGRNATVRGKALRADAIEAAGGHGGTAVFVPEGPFFSFTGDDGSFLFENLPEGRVTLAVFRDGYRPASESLELRAAEVFPLSTIVLERLTSRTPSQVRGRVLLPEGGPAAAVTVSLSGGQRATTDALGEYRFSGVSQGVYSLAFVKEGFLTAELVNLVVSGAVVAVRDVTLAPGTSTTPGLDAGFPEYDAGLGVSVDAGPSVDAGASTDAGVDAGLDAGTSTDAGVDAGLDAGVDAGLDAGVDAGLDAGVDAGLDAGELPVALIDPPPPYVLRNASFQLNAQRSTGARPLTFSWSQDAGPTVTIPFNNTPNAATPTLTAPNVGTVLKFNLTVADPAGRQSAPASVFVPVAVGPPVAVITGAPSTPALGGQRVVLSGATSSDPNTSGLVAWEWTVSPAGLVTVTTLSGGQQLQLDMPASVATPVVVQVQLVVTNGLTMRSAPASASFQLGTGTVPQWYVDAGPQQTVGGGDVVTLRGQAFAPSTGGTFTYRWTPDREPDDGGVADWLLTDPTATTTTFVAPRVDGPTPRLVSFTLTATDTSGTLTPSVRSSQTFVNIVDRRAPVQVGTSVAGGYGPLLSAWVDFDEDLKASTITNITVSPVSGSPSTGVQERFLVGKRRVVLALRPPLAAGFMYNLTVTGVDDLAIPSANRSLGTNVVFLARNSWTPASETLSTSVAEPWPGLVVRRNADLSRSAFAFGRRDGNAWFLAPFDPFACLSPPCTLADDPAAPSLSLGGPMPRGHKGWLVNEEPVATLQVATLQGAPAVMFQRSGASWSPLPAPPNALFSDGTTLSSVRFDDGGVTHVVLDGGAWVPSSVITTSLAEYPTDALADPFAFGNASLGARPMVVLKSSRTDTMRASINNPPWTGMAAAGNGPEARVVTMMQNYPSSGFVFTQRPTGALDELIFGGVNNSAQGVVSGVSSFDALSNWSSVWFVTSVGGQLEAWYISFGNGTLVNRMPGPLRNGMPAFPLNHDLACEAARPELSMADGALFVAWQERCGAGPWRVYVRGLE